MSSEAKGCFFWFLPPFGKRRGSSSLPDQEEPSQEASGAYPAEFPYELKELVSAAELSCYRMLCSVVQGRAVVLAKVCLADIFSVEKSNSHSKYFPKISQKHIDFLLCHPETLKPFCGVELDDRSHQSSDRMDRDGVVNQVFAAAGLPLIRVPAAKAYDVKALENQFSSFLPSSAASRQSTPPPPPPSLTIQSLDGGFSCPKCGMPMIMRVAAKGTNTERKIWVCSTYPQCTGAMAIK